MVVYFSYLHKSSGFQFIQLETIDLQFIEVVRYSMESTHSNSRKCQAWKYVGVVV